MLWHPVDTVQGELQKAFLNLFQPEGQGLVSRKLQDQHICINVHCSYVKQLTRHFKVFS